MTLSQIASLLQIDLKGGGDIEITAMNTLKDATANELSFVSNAKYINDIKDSKAAAILVDAALENAVPSGSVALVVAHPYWAMATLSKHFAPPLEDEDAAEPVIGEGCVISSAATLAKGAVIGSHTQIMAGVYIGSKAVIGDNTVIYPNVVVYRDCHVGNNCVIHANTSIGSDGFGFATNAKGEHLKIYQNGNVVIEDDVELGANTTIDRAVFGSTTIKKGARLDNLIHIAHNCEVGEYSVLTAQVGLAGSTTLGRNVVMGGQSATAGHLSIAPFTQLAARTGVTKSITTPGKTYAGFPFMDHKKWLKLQAKLARLIR